MQYPTFKNHFTASGIQGLLGCNHQEQSLRPCRPPGHRLSRVHALCPAPLPATSTSRRKDTVNYGACRSGHLLMTQAGWEGR